MLSPLSLIGAALLAPLSKPPAPDLLPASAAPSALTWAPTSGKHSRETPMLPRRLRWFARAFALSLPIVVLAPAASAFTRSPAGLVTDGSQADVGAAIAAAAPGDTVSIPEGTFTWGEGGTGVAVNKAITLAGAGIGKTTIQLSPTGAAWTGGVIRITAPATVKGFTVKGADSGHVAAFACGGANGWRITGIEFNGGADSGYFAYTGSYGLIDHCTIHGASGQAELIFGRGPADSWQTPSSMGTADAVYIEECTFDGRGYVCDANSNARFVVRFCTIAGPIKVDAHGKASNTPPRGARQIEVYGNRWTAPGGFWAAMEIRGGTGMIFDNVAENGVGGTRPHILLKEYGCLSDAWGNFGKTFQTAADTPIDDQVGVGQDPKRAGGEPLYLWNNTCGGADWVPSWPPLPPGALARYRAQTGREDATFTMQDVIQAGRDYFRGAVGAPFDGSSGVGVGTKAEMDAVRATRPGVGFWVTDEGEWNSRHPGPDGRLYVWDGRGWVLKYTPYTYPHP